MLTPGMQVERERGREVGGDELSQRTDDLRNLWMEQFLRIEENNIESSWSRHGQASKQRCLPW